MRVSHTQLTYLTFIRSETCWFHILASLCCRRIFQQNWIKYLASIRFRHSYNVRSYQQKLFVHCSRKIVRQAICLHQKYCVPQSQENSTSFIFMYIRCSQLSSKGFTRIYFICEKNYAANKPIFYNFVIVIMNDLDSLLVGNLIGIMTIFNLVVGSSCDHL